MTKVFTGADGTETSTFGVLVKRGYKAGLNYQWNGGYGQGTGQYAVGGADWIVTGTLTEDATDLTDLAEKISAIASIL